MNALIATLYFLSGVAVIASAAVGAGAIRQGLMTPIILDPGPYLAMAVLCVVCAFLGLSLMRLAAWLSHYADDRMSIAQLNLGSYRDRTLRMRPLR
jgi:hypothetical protein